MNETTQSDSAIIPGTLAAWTHAVGEPRLSPDGQWVAFAGSWMGRGDIVVTSVEDRHSVTITTEPTVGASAARGGGSFAWTSDSFHLIYTSTLGELWQVPREGGIPVRLIGQQGCSAPVCRDNHLAFTLDLPGGPHGENTPAHGVSAVCTARLPEAGALFPPQKAPSLLWPERRAFADFCFDPDIRADGALVWHEWDVPDMPWDGGRIVFLQLGAEAERIVLDEEAGVAMGRPLFSPSGTKVAYLCDRSGWWSVWEVDLATGTRALLVEGKGEIGGPAWGQGNSWYAWSPDESRLAFLLNQEARTSISITDLASGDTKQVAGGDGVYGGLTWAGNVLAATWTSFSTAGEIRVIHAETGAITTVSPAGTGKFPPVRSATHFTWKHSKNPQSHPIYGILVHGNTAQQPEPPAPSPLLVWPHGGPTGQSQYAFSGRLHFFLSRGWNVLYVNHRGSTGYGRAHTQALRGRWGEADIEDIAFAVRLLQENGEAAPHLTAIMGGSAGGYAVLQSLLLHPELYAAGISLFGVADLLHLAESTHRFEAHYLDSLVGVLPHAFDRYHERSPALSRHHFSRPLLLLQGGKDKVVPKEQAGMVAERARRSGMPVELHVYPEEAHGWGRPETIKDELARVEKFLKKYVLHLAH